MIETSEKVYCTQQFLNYSFVSVKVPAKECRLLVYNDTQTLAVKRCFHKATTDIVALSTMLNHGIRDT